MTNTEFERVKRLVDRETEIRKKVIENTAKNVVALGTQYAGSFGMEYARSGVVLSESAGIIFGMERVLSLLADMVDEKEI